jgi:hypothetical protein
MNKISNNINDIKKNNKNLNLEHTDNSVSINDTIEYSINQMEINTDNNMDINIDVDVNIDINMDNCENIIQENNMGVDANGIEEKIIELPIKKKKGRKSKKNKELELEQLKPKEIIRPFPKLSEKIFDVLTIDGTEYFYDTDFNLLLDKDVEPVGFKVVDKFIFYSEISNVIENVKRDDLEVKKIFDNLKNFK